MVLRDMGRIELRQDRYLLYDILDFIVCILDVNDLNRN